MPTTLHLDWFGDVLAGKDIKPAFDNLFRRGLKSGGEYIIKIPRISMTLNSMIVFPQGLKSCEVMPEDPSSSTDTTIPEFVKRNGYTDQYMFYFAFSKNLLLNELSFFGTDDIWASVNQTIPVYMWGKEGVYFGSCEDMTVNNCNFKKLGDSAVRMTTHIKDPNPLGSKNGTIQNCTFENVYQVTTTSSGDSQKGGTQNWTVQNNTFKNMGGGLKYASRQPCGQAKIHNNTIDGSHDKGIDLSGVSNIEISGNTIKNIKSAAISYYTNSLGVPYACGDFTIRDNSFESSGGLYFGNKPFEATDKKTAGQQFVFNDLWVVRNQFKKMLPIEGNNYIVTTTGPFDTVILAKNEVQESPNMQLNRTITGTNIVIGANSIT